MTTMKTVTCDRLVWLRELPHERGTIFTVVGQSKKPTDVDPATAERWRQEGWLETDKPKAAAASDGA